MNYLMYSTAYLEKHFVIFMGNSQHADLNNTIASSLVEADCLHVGVVSAHCAIYKDSIETNEEHSGFNVTRGAKSCYSVVA